MVLSACSEPYASHVGLIAMAPGEGLAGWVAAHREPVFITQNAASDPRMRVFEEFEEEKYQSIVSVPLLAKDASVLGVVALPLLYGAARGGSRPAMVAVGAIGVIALLIAVIGDHPDITQAGTVFTQRYEDARAEALIAYSFEFVGAILVVLSAGLLLLADVGRSEPAPRPRAGRDAAADES